MQNNSDILESTRLKVVRLSNQLLVGNFSSPHQFTFDDGTVLDAVSDYDSMRLKVIFKMHQHNDVDIVLCPLPMIEAFQLEGLVNGWIVNSPFRAVRMKDRIAKTVSCNTFTI